MQIRVEDTFQWEQAFNKSLNIAKTESWRK